MSADSPVQREGGRAELATRGLQPLRRKPKTLTDDPSLYEPAGGGRGAGMVLSGGRGRRPGRGDTRPGTDATGTTEEEGALVGADAAREPVDPEVVRRAREIAARLAIPRARQDTVVRRGSGRLSSVRYTGDSDEIDLDATLDNLVAHPFPTDDDIVVRQRQQTRRSIVLVVDVSGSMRGERVRTAAATVGAVVGRLGGGSGSGGSSGVDLAVVAFWSDAALLVPLGTPVTPQHVLDLLLRLPAQGLTNVGFPLQVAGEQLARVPVRDARVLLLSDCVHNAGPDPRIAAGRLPRLDVLLDASGEHDTDLARDLAQVGRGRLAVARSHRDVGPALSRIFAT